MAIRDLFSKREARVAKAGQPDVYQYDHLPERLRVQVVHIFRRAILQQYWPDIERQVAEEHGVFLLGNGDVAMQRCIQYLLTQQDATKVLDLIEAALEEAFRQSTKYPPGLLKLNEAIAELNTRFREHFDRVPARQSTDRPDGLAVLARSNDEAGAGSAEQAGLCGS